MIDLQPSQVSGYDHDAALDEEAVEDELARRVGLRGSRAIHGHVTAV